MIVVSQRGNFKHTEGFFKRAKEKRFYKTLNEYAKKGVDALAAATPVDTGKTAASWTYEVQVTESGAHIYWKNTNVKEGYAFGQQGVVVALLLQYGHATRNGGWVEGIDYINPALRPVFEEIADKVWAEVNAP